ncbi:HmuY family protein [Candidatus Palauibacter sp.]|uniref:HmuY family protein n=1 Tax=Candidatus Palauibacter sp. TaxID=3101350 RepID=UPI003B51F92B
MPAGLRGGGPDEREVRRPLGLYLGGGGFLLVIAVVVAGSFVRPDPLTFIPTPVAPQPPVDRFVVDTVTVDARDGSQWVYFDFDKRSAVDGPLAGWDLALNRYHVVVNGGSGYPGAGGAIAVNESWEAVLEAPASGYATTEGSLDGLPGTPGLERWYRYGFFSHLLEPKDETYVIRTAEGRYAKVRILSYYCPQATPGCVTLLYGYQGDGSRRLTG